MSERIARGRDYAAPNDASPASSIRASPPQSFVDAFHAGIATEPEPAPDLRVPGKPPDISALMPWLDVDHALATVTVARQTPPPLRSTTKQVAPTTAPTTAASTAAVSPDFAEKLAAAKASAFNLELEVLRLSGDPKAKYKVQDVLERADDSATRKKMKEQYAATNDGQTFDTMISSSKGLDERAKKHALDLMSDRRDATTDKLATMTPEARAKLEDEAAVWADQLLHFTRPDSRDDSEHADKIANILGPRSPEELEVIRSRVRLQTSGTQRTTAYEELDRTFTGRDKDIALAGLTGSPTHLASTRLVDAAMEGDPARIHRIVKELPPEKLAELRTRNPMLLAQVASSMPAEYRAEIEAALGGSKPEAEGARIATLLQPVDLSVADTRDAAKTKRLVNRKEAQEPERMIEELGKMSAADLEAARNAWDKENPNKSWDSLIGERYKDADSTVRLRIEAAARGDKIGERALRLRQGMRTFDQQLIDGALYNSDLKSDDPKKRSTAEAERRELEARMEQYDAGDQRTKAKLEGKPTPDAVVGRSTDDQLDAYYKKAEFHDSEASGDFMDRATHVATKDERMAKVREKANADRYAAKEMSREGEAHASTKVRRAELSGNALQKAEILERLDSKKTEGSKNTLEAQGAEYRMKFGARDMLSAPELSNLADAADAVAMLTGDERPPHEIAAELSRKDMDVGEVRMEHIRETGVLTDRTRGQRLEQQKEIRDLTESGWLDGSEHMRFLRGGNRGSEDLLRSSIKLMERGNAEGVDDREQSRRDRSTTQAVDLQREEKQREAAKVAQVISFASKIAAIATANPALFVAVDAGFGLLRVAANELIANESNDATSDLKHVGVDVVLNLVTAKLAGLGKGVQAGTQAAKGVQMAQRIGNVGAAVGGAAAHSAIDGEDGGGAVVRAAFGALLPGYLRGKAENAIQGPGQIASGTRAVVGTTTDIVSNAVVSGGHLDSGSLVDAVGNTKQGHGHGRSKNERRAHPSENVAPSREHSRLSRELPVHSTPDLDQPNRRTRTGEQHDIPEDPIGERHTRKALERPQLGDEHAREAMERHADAPRARPSDQAQKPQQQQLAAVARGVAEPRAIVVNGETEPERSGARHTSATFDGGSDPRVRQGQLNKPHATTVTPSQPDPATIAFGHYAEDAPTSRSRESLGEPDHIRAVRPPATLDDVRARRGEGERWTNLQVRDYYNARNSEIGILDAQWKQEGLSPEARARKASEFRHEMRLVGREMMSNDVDKIGLLVRDAQKYGDGGGPRFDQLVEQQHARGKDGDAAYDAIVGGAQRTDPETNKRVAQGETRPPDVELPPGTTVYGDKVVLTAMNGAPLVVFIKRGSGRGPIESHRNPDGTFNLSLSKDVPGEVALRQVASELGKMAGTPRQKSGDLDHLYGQAVTAQKQLGDLTGSVADELHGTALVPENLKGRERTQEKIDADYEGEAARITDLARSTIVFDTPQQIQQAMGRIRDRAEVVRLKDRFAEPAGGYRDVMLNLRMPNGHIVEIQLHLKAILDVKNGPGHQLYEQIRSIYARVKRENRVQAPEERATVKKLQNEMKGLYDEAYEDSMTAGPADGAADDE